MLDVGGSGGFIVIDTTERVGLPIDTPSELGDAMGGTICGAGVTRGVESWCSESISFSLSGSWSRLGGEGS